MQQVLTLADTHYRFGKALTASTAAQVGQLWRRVDRNAILPSWLGLLPAVTAVVTAAQDEMAADSAAYVGAALAAQGIDPDGQALSPSGFGGFSYPLNGGPAQPLAVMFASPAFESLQKIRQGLSVPDAMASGLSSVMLRTQSATADAARAAESVSISSTKVQTGWVRMLNPPSCSRCAILAGKWYRWNQGFPRHPGCDCRHIPSPESTSDDLRTDPYQYFESLDDAEKRRVFTNAGAKAIDDGADMFQVVNARSGMSTTAGGSKVTNYGTTRKGYWGSNQATRDRRGNEQYGKVIRQRMMPEEIYKRANSRDQAISMLEDYGYILPQGQIPEGAIRGPGVGNMGDRYRLNRPRR